MKVFTRFFIAISGILVIIAPFITKNASACAFLGNELEIPKHLQ